jgi:hypothetical protein
VRGPLSNRPPTTAEKEAGAAVLRFVLAHIFTNAQPLAVGRVAQTTLAALGFDRIPYLRHPAMGGAAEFTAGLAEHCPPPM